MLVEILVTQPFADWPGSGTNRKLATFDAGQIVDFPADYVAVLLTCKPIPIAIVKDKKVIISKSDITTSAATYALEKDIDISEIEGTGTGGRITLADVRAVRG